MMRKSILFGLVFICLASLVSSLDDSNLVDSWNLDNNNLSGSHYLNLVFGRPALIQNGTTGISGIHNEGWYSDTQSDALYNSSTDLDYSSHTEGTYSMWLNATAWTLLDDTWFSISTDNINNINNMFYLRSAIDGTLAARLRTNGVTRFTVVVSHPEPLNEWVNVVIKVNETNASVWFDGVELGTGATNGYWLANLTGTWGHINFLGDTTEGGVVGKIDEINIFDAAKSDADILLLNSTFYPFAPSNIVLSDFNLTSGWSGASWDNESPYDTYNTTPTFTFSTSINGNCSLNGTVCSTGEGTKVHTCLFGSVLPYSMTFQNINVSCFSTSNINTTNESILDVLIHSFTNLNLTSVDIGDSTTQNLTCSATSVNDLINMSLYITDNQNNSFAINNTVSITGKTNSTTWEVELSEGNYTWGCLAYDNVWGEWGNHSLILDLEPPNINTTLNNTYWTNEIIYNITFTDLSLKNISFIDSCGNNFSNTSPPTPYNVNKTYNISSCGLGQKQTNITACDMVNCITEVYTWFSMGTLNISVYDSSWNSISNFSIYLEGVFDGNTTTGYYNLDNLSLGSHTIEVDAPGYEIQSTDVTTNSTYQEYNFSLYTTNSITFIFKDEENKSILDGVSKDLELISDEAAYNHTTTNGTYYVDLISPAIYLIRYNIEGFNERFYFFNLTNRTHTNITLYAINVSEQTEATILDETNTEIEGAYIKVMRYDLETNTYITRGMGKSNFLGKTKLNLVLNKNFYKFLIYYPFGTLVKETSPSYIYENLITFQVSLYGETGDNFYNSQGIDYALSFNNATNNFRLTYSDNNNVVTEGCLDVYTETLMGSNLYDSSCSTSPTATILVNIDNTSGVVYQAKAYVDFTEGGEYYLTSEIKSFKDPNPSGKLGVFLIIILTVVFAFIGYWDKTIALIITPLPLFFGSMLHIIDLSIVVTLPVEIICIIIAIVISREK